MKAISAGRGVAGLVACHFMMVVWCTAHAAERPILRLGLDKPTGLAYQAMEVEPQPRADFLAGRVVDSSGRPVAGAKVDAFQWYPGSETTTDISGAFRLGNTDPKRAFLAPGEKIEVTFSAPGYTPATSRFSHSAI